MVDIDFSKSKQIILVRGLPPRPTISRLSHGFQVDISGLVPDPVEIVYLAARIATTTVFDSGGPNEQTVTAQDGGTPLIAKFVDGAFQWAARLNHRSFTDYDTGQADTYPAMVQGMPDGGCVVVYHLHCLSGQPRVLDVEHADGNVATKFHDINVGDDALQIYDSSSEAKPAIVVRYDDDGKVIWARSISFDDSSRTGLTYYGNVFPDSNHDQRKVLAGIDWYAESNGSSPYNSELYLGRGEPGETLVADVGSNVRTRHRVEAVLDLDTGIFLDHALTYKRAGDGASNNVSYLLGVGGTRRDPTENGLASVSAGMYLVSSSNGPGVRVGHEGPDPLEHATIDAYSQNWVGMVYALESDGSARFVLEVGHDGHATTYLYGANMDAAGNIYFQGTAVSDGSVTNLKTSVTQDDGSTDQWDFAIPASEQATNVSFIGKIDRDGIGPPTYRVLARGTVASSSHAALPVDTADTPGGNLISFVRMYGDEASADVVFGPGQGTEETLNCGGPSDGALVITWSQKSDLAYLGGMKNVQGFPEAGFYAGDQPDQQYLYVPLLVVDSATLDKDGPNETVITAPGTSEGRAVGYYRVDKTERELVDHTLLFSNDTTSEYADSTRVYGVSGARYDDAPFDAIPTLSPQVGVAFSYVPTVSYVTPVSYKLIGPSLPTGLSFNTTTGEISGTATNPHDLSNGPYCICVETAADNYFSNKFWIRDYFIKLPYAGMLSTTDWTLGGSATKGHDTNDGQFANTLHLLSFHNGVDSGSATYGTSIDFAQNWVCRFTFGLNDGSANYIEMRTTDDVGGAIRALRFGKNQRIEFEKDTDGAQLLWAPASLDGDYNVWLEYRNTTRELSIYLSTASTEYYDDWTRPDLPIATVILSTGDAWSGSAALSFHGERGATTAEVLLHRLHIHTWDKSLSSPPSIPLDMTLWIQGDNLDGSENSTLSDTDSLDNVINHGTGFHFEDMGSPPTYTENALNGLGCITLDGSTNNGLNSTGGQLLQDFIQDDTWEVFVVTRSTLFSPDTPEYEGPRVLGDQDGYWSLMPVDSSGDKWSGYAWDGDAEYVRDTGVDGDDQLVVWRADGVTPTMYLSVDAGSEQSEAMDNPVDSDGMDNPLEIGNGVGSGADEFVGRIYEMIIYDRTLTTQERSDVKTYLTNKWGL